MCYASTMPLIGHRLLCGVVLSAVLALRAETPLECDFRVPPPGGARPLVALSVPFEAFDGEWLSVQMRRVRELGAGGVLLELPAADEAAWGMMARAAFLARQAGLEVGFVFQPTEALRLQRLVWAWSPAAGALVPGVAEGGVPVGRFAVPAAGAGEVHAHQLREVAEGERVEDGPWTVYRFMRRDVEPARLDMFDEKAVTFQVNRWLSACQERMGAEYGRTVLWCHFPGVPRGEMLWPRDLPELFLKRTGLGLSRYLPVLAGREIGGARTSEHVRQQVAGATRGAWRERFGRRVDELVHEAGLDAGMRVDEAPLDPEEVALYFKRPVLPSAADGKGREANARAAGGARVMGRRVVLGRIAACGGAEEAGLWGIPWKGEADALFADGATRLLFDAGRGVPGEDAAFRALSEACLYAHRCQVMLRQGEAVADLLVWAESRPEVLSGYSCDYVNGAMLDTAAMRGERLRFESERSYGVLAVTSEVLAGKGAAERVKRLGLQGLRVVLIPTGAAGEEELFGRLQAEVGERVSRVAERRGLMRLPDLEWRPQVEGVSVSFLHRRSAEYEIYFVANVGDGEGPVSLVFRDVGEGVPERWDPARGETGRAMRGVQRLEDGRVAAELFLAPRDACFVVFSR